MVNFLDCASVERELSAPAFRREAARRSAQAFDEANAAPRAETGETARFCGASTFLAYAGAAPLIVAALAIVAGVKVAAASAFMALFGGILLAFFGGVRWGVAVMRPEGPTFLNLLGGALPLAAAMPVFAPWDVRAKFVYVAGVLFLMLMDDLRATRAGSGAPGWYLGVRAPLTVLMVMAYAVALAATYGG